MNILSRLRRNIFKALLSHERPMTYFDSSRRNTPGALGVALTEDAATASKAITMSFAAGVRSLSSVTYSTFLMFRISPSLLAISASVVPVIGGGAILFSKYIKTLSKKQREVTEQAADFAEERLNHIEMIKMCGRNKDEVETYEEMQRESVRLGRKVALADGVFMGGIFAATSAALLMVFYAGGKAVSAGKMTTGSLTSFATYSFLLGVGTSGLFKATSEVSAGILAGERVFDIIEGYSDTSDEDKEEESTKEASDNDSNETDRASCRGNVQFTDVSFFYETSPEKTVLNNVSLELKAGSVLALVGKNGAGKSTIVSLLGALYKPTNGTITLDNISLQDIPRKHLCKRVSVVSQTPALLSTSIMENIRYAKPDATESEIQHVAEIANITQFLPKLEGGMDYNVGRHGCRLSGGQRQRIALARALLTNPSILILDEPTSQLDAEGEGAVEDAVKLCREAGRSLLLVTHRRKTLQMADEVCVLQGGMVVESGRFEELSVKKGSELQNLMPNFL
mmetsp:Transcript_9088/g.13183  ORF Transcript_9088/g.13183 Transcript_9088/m.13183 type:complete len:511 (+) Transcript_9088:607-2139(+)